MPTSNFRNPYSTASKYLKETDIPIGIPDTKKKPKQKKEDTYTKLPRIYLKDKLGYRLDTLTTFQNNIYQAELNVRNAKEPMTAEEWRLPIAPVPARPDYSRTEPIFWKSRKGLQKHVHPHVTMKSTPAPPLPYTGADVDDVAFVAESLNRLPHFLSLSYLRQELVLPPKTYFQFAHHVYFHNKYLSETDRREAVYHFPGFCSGCQRYSLCYGCERSSEPHYHLDGRHKHADEDHWPGHAKGFGTGKRRHPLSGMEKFMKEHGLTPEQLELLEQEAQRLMRQKSFEERTGSILPRISDSDADISTGQEQTRHRTDDNVTEDEGIMTDKTSMVNTDDDDNQVPPSGYRSGQSSRDLQGFIDIDMAERRDGTEENRQYGNRDGTMERYRYGSQDGMVKDLEKERDSPEKPSESRGQIKSQRESFRDGSSRYSFGSYRHGHSSSKYSYDSRQRTSDEDDENLSPSPSSKSSNSKRRRLYRAPPPFKIKKRQRKALKSRSPFSTERKYDIPQGSGFQLKKGERRVTEFEEFKRKDINWKPPPKYELKTYEAKKTEFWSAPKPKDKSKKSKKRDQHAFTGSRRPTSPDSGLDSEKTSDGGNSDKIARLENYGRGTVQKKPQIYVRIPQASDKDCSSSEDTDFHCPSLSFESFVCLTSSEPDLELSFNDVIEVNKLEVSPENQRKHKHKKRRRKQVETKCEDNENRFIKSTQPEDLDFADHFQKTIDKGNAPKDPVSIDLLTITRNEGTNHREKNEDIHYEVAKRSAEQIKSTTGKHTPREENITKGEMLNKRKLNNIGSSRTVKERFRDVKSSSYKLSRKHKRESPVDFDKLPSIDSMLQKVLSGIESKSKNDAQDNSCPEKNAYFGAAFPFDVDPMHNRELDAYIKSPPVEIKDGVCHTHDESPKLYVEAEVNRNVADLEPERKTEHNFQVNANVISEDPSVSSEMTDVKENNLLRQKPKSLEKQKKTALMEKEARRQSLPIIEGRGNDIISDLVVRKLSLTYVHPSERKNQELKQTENIIVSEIPGTIRSKKIKVKNPRRVGNVKVLKRLEETEELEFHDNYMEDVECSFMSKHQDDSCAKTDSQDAPRKEAHKITSYGNDETTASESIINDTWSARTNEISSIQRDDTAKSQESRTRSESQSTKTVNYQRGILSLEYPSISNQDYLQHSQESLNIAQKGKSSDALSIGRNKKGYFQAKASERRINHTLNDHLSSKSKDVHADSHNASRHDLDFDKNNDISQKSHGSTNGSDIEFGSHCSSTHSLSQQQESKTYRDVSQIFEYDKPNNVSNSERFVLTPNKDCMDAYQSQKQAREISTIDEVVAVPADMPPTTSSVKLEPPSVGRDVSTRGIPPFRRRRIMLLGGFDGYVDWDVFAPERISTPTSRQLSTPESRLTTPSGVMTRYNEVVTQLPQVLSPSLPDHPPYTIVDRPKKEKIKRSRKEAKEVERKQSASPATTPVPAQSSNVEPVVLDKSPITSPTDSPSLPPLELPPLPEIKDEPKGSKNKDSNRTQIQTGQKLKPVHAPLPKKNVSKANLKTPLSKPKKRGKSAAEAPVTSDEMKELQDPLDFLKQYCIIHQDRLPFYERIYTNIIECQSPRYDRERPLSPRTGMPMDTIPEWGEHEMNMFHDMIVINRGQDSTRIGLTAAEQYLEKICYTLEILSKKKDHISDNLEELDISKTKKIADRGRELVRDIHRPDYVKKEKKSKKKKKKKDQGSPVQLLRPDDITDAIIVSRIEDKLLKTICKEPEIFQLEVEMQRCREKLAEIDERIVQLDGEKNILGMYCMQVFFMEQNDNRKPLEFRRAQSALYSKLHPHLDIEMNMDELEGALQLINNNLLSDREFGYLFHILNLPGRRKINFQLFSIVAALSEKVTQMDPFIRKLINKMDYNALSAKMDRSKDLFQLLCDGDPEPTPRGNATASNLALELMAGGLTPEHTKYVLSKFNREGTGYVDFLDFVMYIPLFIEIHERIVKDPLRLPLDVC